MLNISEEYFNGETRCDFFISPMIKKAFAAQMEIAEEIRKVCERHDIRYFAALGTLLGTVRHGGFIPWDDDIDFNMMRNDVEKFLEFAPSELPEGYMVLNIKTNSEYKDAMTRVVNSSGIDWSPEHLEKFHDCPFVCGIDIFTIDKLPRSKQQVDVMCSIGLAVDETLKLLWHSDYDFMKHKAVKEIEKACGIRFKKSRPIDIQLLEFVEETFGRYKDLPEEEYDEVVMMPAIMHSDIRSGTSKEAYGDVEWRDFEGIIKLPVPVGYDEILSKHYGADYMVPKQFETHDYPFFKKQQQDIINYMEQHPEIQKDVERFLN